MLTERALKEALPGPIVRHTGSVLRRDNP